MNPTVREALQSTIDSAASLSELNEIEANFTDTAREELADAIDAKRDELGGGLTVQDATLSEILDARDDLRELIDSKVDEASRQAAEETAAQFRSQPANDSTATDADEPGEDDPSKEDEKDSGAGEGADDDASDEDEPGEASDDEKDEDVQRLKDRIAELEAELEEARADDGSEKSEDSLSDDTIKTLRETAERLELADHNILDPTSLIVGIADAVAEIPSTKSLNTPTRSSASDFDQLMHQFNQQEG